MGFLHLRQLHVITVQPNTLPLRQSRRKVLVYSLHLCVELPAEVRWPPLFQLSHPRRAASPLHLKEGWLACPPVFVELYGCLEIEIRLTAIIMNNYHYHYYHYAFIKKVVPEMKEKDGAISQSPKESAGSL